MVRRLAFQGHVQHLLRKHGADAEADVFQFRQRDAPGQAGGAIELVDEILGDALHIGPQFFDLGSGFFGSCHP